MLPRPHSGNGRRTKIRRATLYAYAYLSERWRDFLLALQEQHNCGSELYPEEEIQQRQSNRDNGMALEISRCECNYLGRVSKRGTHLETT